jgi:alpha-1,2-mannosyltransferase
VPAAAVWLIGAVSVALAVWGAVALASVPQLDFSVYVMGARHLVDGRLYEVSLAAVPHLPFTYPPFAALVFAPLAVVPLVPAQVAWSLVNVVALFAIVRLSVGVALPAWSRQWSLALSLVLVAPAFVLEPVHLTFFFGQVNLVLAAMVLFDLTGRLRVANRALPRGVLVGVAAAVKLVPLVFVAYLFVTRQTRAAWTALASFAVCCSAVAALDPSVSWKYWTKYATDATRIGNASYISNQSLRAVADRIDHRVVSMGVVALVCAVVLVAGIALAWWAARSSSNFLGILVCATTGLLVSPVTWAHHLVWVVPVLIWLVWAPDRPVFGRLWAAAGVALFWWAPIWTVPNGANRELSEHGWQLVRGNSFALAMVVFMAGIAVMLSVRRAGATGADGE